MIQSPGGNARRSPAAVQAALRPDKDADGLHPLNLGTLVGRGRAPAAGSLASLALAWTDRWTCTCAHM